MSFRYPDDQWKEVYDLLSKTPDGDNYHYENVRADFERCIENARKHTPSYTARVNRDYGRIARTSQKLLDFMNSDFGERYTSIHKNLLHDIESLSNMAKRFIRSRSGRNWRKNDVCNMLVMYWEDAWGEARTSTAADQTPSGPLVRFMLAATRGTGFDLTAQSARDYVRKHRRQLLQHYSVATLEEAYQKHREIHPGFAWHRVPERRLRTWELNAQKLK